MRFIFANVIAAGQIDWKRPLTAAGQPPIQEAALIYTDENLDMLHEDVGELSGEILARYASAVGNGAIVVGHSVEYQHGHLRAAMIAAGLDPSDGRAQTICTMFGLTGHVPKQNGRKGWPSFGDVCHHYGITRAGRLGEESAEDNARCLREAFRTMVRLGIVPEPKVWKERNG
jgi:DNA polymerase III epsilon subunit-like protein